MKSLTLAELQSFVLDQAKAKGFGISISEVNVAEKFALIHSEISEAYEAYRNKDFDGDHGVAIELGDALQRILHLAGILEIDLEAAIAKKLADNKSRSWNWDKLNETHT